MNLEQRAKDAIKAVFTDRSVSPAETKSRLKGLIEEIEILIDSIEETDNETDEE